MELTLADLASTTNMSLRQIVVAVFSALGPLDSPSFRARCRPFKWDVPRRPAGLWGEDRLAGFNVRAPTPQTYLQRIGDQAAAFSRLCMCQGFGVRAIFDCEVCAALARHEDVRVCLARCFFSL